MTVTRTMTEAEFLQLLLDDPDTHWELHCGELRSIPPITWEHVRAGATLGHQIQQQLDPADYLVLSEAGRLRRSSTSYYLPDVMVVPIALADRLFPEPGMVAAFPDPLPFVAEVWSRSTGAYDVRDRPPSTGVAATGRSGSSIRISELSRHGYARPPAPTRNRSIGAARSPSRRCLGSSSTYMHCSNTDALQRRRD